MSQTKYIEKILLCLGSTLQIANQLSPCEVSSNKICSANCCIQLTAKCIGNCRKSSIRYDLHKTRSSFCLTKLSQHLSAPTVANLKAAKHVFPCLKEFSDWGSQKDRRSMTGYNFLIPRMVP